MIVGLFKNRTGEFIRGQRPWMEEEMREFVDTEGCKRVVLDKVIDRRTLEINYKEDEEVCCSCEERFKDAEDRNEAEMESEDDDSIGWREMVAKEEEEGKGGQIVIGRGRKERAGLEVPEGDRRARSVSREFTSGV